jgi:hypothetical protein
MSCDLQNAYLNAPCQEEIWFEGGIKCGKDQGKVCVVVRSLYRLKSAGDAFRSSLALILRDFGFKSTKANPDLWIHKAVKDNGHQYYEMLFVYVDNIMALSHQAEDAIKEITAFYKAKDGSIKPPEIYLGANVSRMQLPDGREVWTTSPKTYVKNSLIVVECLLNDDGERVCIEIECSKPFSYRFVGSSY